MLSQQQQALMIMANLQTFYGTIDDDTKNLTLAELQNLIKAS
ncbi:hypothetical protein [Vibrio sp. 10N.261.49.C12]